MRTAKVLEAFMGPGAWHADEVKTYAPACYHGLHLFDLKPRELSRCHWQGGNRVGGPPANEWLKSWPCLVAEFLAMSWSYSCPEVAAELFVRGVNIGNPRCVCVSVCVCVCVVRA